jgi:uncharacterized protein
MNRVFVDTSAIIALLHREDENHEKAAKGFSDLERLRSSLFSTSYVLVETYALLVRRFGKAPAVQFRRGFEPLLEIVWVDQSLHDAGLDLLFSNKGRRLSLVDAVSFTAMRSLRINTAFAYDAHFEQAGFETL